MNKQKLNFDLIILGDPASGKDTQAALLMKKYPFKAVESGKHWRAMAKKKNAEGAWLRRTMALGHPTPVVLMKKFLQDNLSKAPGNKNLIFIGNPRLKPEAQLLVKLLKEKKRDFFVIYIKVPVTEVYKRTQGRERNLPESTAQGIKNRLNYTKNQVSKTVKYFQSLKKLKFINGKQSISQVTKDIEKALNDYSRS